MAKPQGKPKTKPKSQRLKKIAKLRPAAAATKPVAGAAAGAKPKLVKAKVCTKKLARNPIKMPELEWDASNLKRNNAGRNLIKTNLDELHRRDLAQKPGNPPVDAKTGIIRANVGWEGLTFTRFLALAPGHFEKLWVLRSKRHSLAEAEYGEFVIQEFTRANNELDRGNRVGFIELMAQIVEGVVGTDAARAVRGQKRKRQPSIACGASAAGWDAAAAVEYELEE